MNKKRKERSSALAWVLFSCLVLFLFFSFFIYELVKPQKVKSASFTSISATLSNPRLSYKAGVASGTAGASLITIDGSGNPDNDTNHLYIGDLVCFSPTLFGCHDDTTYSVVSTPTSTTFNVSTALGTTLGGTDYVIATQSGTLTLTFTLANDIPDNGDIYITIPRADSQDGAEGFPDASGTDPSTGGFDLGLAGSTIIGTGDVTVTESCGGSFSVANVTAGTGGNDHTIEINNGTAACAASSQITVTIGNTSNSHLLINPAPVTSARSRGVAEIYTINVKTRDGSSNTIDNSDVLIAPVEGIFVSATVDESLYFQIEGVTADSGTYCGATRTGSTPDTTAYTIPWGTLSTTYAEATHNTSQELTVTTNADSGYKVFVQQEDQMGKDGAVCSGVAPSSGDFTFSGSTCIRDSVCASTPCTHIAGREWGADPSSYPGMGYSLQNVSGEGTDAKFLYSSSTDPCDASASTGTYCAKQIADHDRGSGSSEDETTSGAEVMINTGPVDTNSVYVCYRIDLPGTQPAGFYYSTIKYTAVPIF